MIRTESSFRCMTHGRYSTLGQATKRAGTRAQRDKPELPPHPQSAKTVRHQVSQHCTRPFSSEEATARKAFDAAEARYKLVEGALGTWRADVRDWGVDIKETRKLLKGDPPALEERLAFLSRRLANAKAQTAVARKALHEANKARKAAFRGLCDALGIKQAAIKLPATA